MMFMAGAVKESSATASADARAAVEGAAMQLWLIWTAHLKQSTEEQQASKALTIFCCIYII